MEYRFPQVLKSLLRFHPVYHRKVTGTEFAGAIHVTQSTVSHYTRGRVSPSAETMLLIAEYFQVSVDYLLTGEDTNRKVPSDALIASLRDAQDQAAAILGNT